MTAVGVSIDPGLPYRHETVLEEPEDQGARGRGRGTPREEVAETFSVSVPTVKRWLKRRRETGGVEAIPISGRPRVKGAALEGWLPEHLEKNHDLTLAEHREAFEEHSGVAVSASTVGRAIARLPGGWPLKKSPP